MPAYFGIQENTNLGGTYDTEAYKAALEKKMYGTDGSGNANRPFGCFRNNGWWATGDPRTGGFNPDVSTAYAAGRKFTYVNDKPDPIAGDGTYMQWASVAAGKYDGWFDAAFAKVAADSRWTTSNPFHYSFHHEQEGTAEGGGALAGTPAQYVAAYRRVAYRLWLGGWHRDQGGNILLCFVPDASQYLGDPSYGHGGQTYSVTACSPIRTGTQDYSSTVLNTTTVTGHMGSGQTVTKYFDITGGDLYSKSGTARSFPSMAGPVHAFATDVGVPWLTGECGCDVSNSPTTFASDMLNFVKNTSGAGSGAGQCIAINYTSRIASGGDYRMDSSAAIQAAWKTTVTDTTFSAQVGGPPPNPNPTFPTVVTAAPNVTTPTTEIDVTWSGATDTNGTIGHYKVEYKVSTATTWNLDSSSPSASPHTITGLTPGTTYNFKVETWDVDNSTHSAFSTVTGTATTHSTGGVAPDPTNANPSISDPTPAVNENITTDADASHWGGDQPITFTYQWQHSASGTGSWTNCTGTNNGTVTYTVDSTDLAKHLRCLVTGTNTFGNASKATGVTSPVTSPSATIPTTPSFPIPGFFDPAFVAGSHAGRVNDAILDEVTGVVYVASAAPDVIDEANGGGTFTNVAYLTAYRSDNGHLIRTARFGVDGQVRRLRFFGTRLYAFGDFGHAGNGQIRQGMAAFEPLASMDDVNTPNLIATGNIGCASVYDCDFASSFAIVAGTFTSAGGHLTNNVARYNVSGDTWTVSTTFTAGSPSGGIARACAIAPSVSLVVVGGNYGLAGGPKVHAMSTGTGVLSSWGYQPPGNPGIFSMAKDASGVYIAGGPNSGDATAYVSWVGSGPNSLTCSGYTFSGYWFWTTDGNHQVVRTGVVDGVESALIGHHGNWRASAVNTVDASGHAHASNGLLVVSSAPSGGTHQTYGDPPAFGADSSADPLKLWAIYVTTAGDAAFFGGDFDQVGGVSYPRLAQFGIPSVTITNSPPTTPANLSGDPLSDSSIGLAWDPSTDPDGNLAAYRIYQDGVLVATVSA